MMENLLPVGLSSVMASLPNNGHFETKLFDTTFYRFQPKSSDEIRVLNYQIPPFSYSDFGVSYKQNDMYDDFYNLVKTFQPDLLAITATEPTYPIALCLLNTVKKFGITTVIGGIHAMIDHKNIIHNDLIDIVCLGEGEKCFPELCNRMLSGDDYNSLPNFWIKKDGKINRNPKSELIPIEETPPLDFSLFEKERFFRPMGGDVFRMVSIEFSRGCPYKCSYCADPFLTKNFKEQGNWLRLKEVEQVINEIKMSIKKYNAEYFYFVSETFLAVPEKWLHEFVEKYRNINIPFWFNTRPETISKNKMVKLQEVGLHRLSIGVEQGNEEFRKKMLRRNVSNKKMRGALSILDDLDINYSVNNIIGFPDETRDMVFETIELNRNIKSKSIGCYIFSPYKGTFLREYCLKKGYFKADLISGNPHMDAVLNMPTMSNSEITGLARTFAMYSKFPKSYWPLIKKAEKDSPEGHEIFQKLGKEFIKTFFNRA